MKRAILGAVVIIACLAGLVVWRTAKTHAGKEVSQPSAAAAAPPQQSAPAQPGPASPVTQAATSAPPVKPGDTTERRLGPFVISGKEYAAILREQLPAGAKPGEGLTVVGLDIRDAAGLSQYARTFPNITQIEGFVESVSVSVNPVSGAGGNGLLVRYDEYSEPSAPEPESGAFWQVFGVVNGKLKPFSGPIHVRGDLLPVEAASKPQPPTPGALITAPGDLLYFKVWTGRFRLIYPVRMDWGAGQLVPGESCGNPANSGAEACDYKVLPEDDRPMGDATFVRLCSSPNDACAKPEHAVVNTTSTVQLMLAHAQVQFVRGRPSGPSGDPKKALDDAGGIGVISKELWLKVRIDGKEGWIHSQEDFDALQMPSDP